MVQDLPCPFFHWVIAGWIIYFPSPSILNLVIGLLVAAVGFVIGIVWATKVFRSKEGTAHFLSRVSSSPDADQKVEEKKE